MSITIIILVIKEVPESQSDSHSIVVGAHLKIKIEQEDILANMVQHEFLLFCM